MAPSIPDKIPCNTAKDLRYALDPLRPLIEQPETEENWDKIARALQTIAALTRGGAAEVDSEYVKEIRTFSALILNSMNSERTRLANVAVDLFTVFAPPLGSRFEPLIGIFVPTLIRLLGRTNKVFVSRATAGLRAIITHCPHPRLLVELRIMTTDKSPALRVLVGAAVLQCMNEWDWSVHSLAAKAGDVESVIRALGTDSNVDARKIARQIFDRYKQTFPDRVDSFLEPLTPVIKRYLDIKSKPSRDEGGPASRKHAPVPVPLFKPAPAPAPAPASAPPAQPVFDQQVEPARPKMTRVGLSKSGPSRAPVVDSHHTQAHSAPIHSRVVSGPERIVRDYISEAVVSSGPMRTVVPSSTHAGHPVMRSVSASGPSRTRVDPPAPYPAVSVTTDPQPSSHSQPTAEPMRRFRPARAPMDPSQMPQRVAIPPPAPKPTVDPKKLDGPSRVNLGIGTRSVSGSAVAPPTRVVSASVKADHALKISTTAPVLSASANEPRAQGPPLSAPMLPSITTKTSAPLEHNASSAPIPSPTSVPIPTSAPVSRPASAMPPDSRPPSVASNTASKSQQNAPSTSNEPASTTSATLVKPALAPSKSVPITTKVSALIKRGNPYAPPPFVPKRAPASGGVGAGTASQMTRQREAIAAREKRESEEAAKKAKREVTQKKDAKGNEGKKASGSSAPAASSRSKPASSQSTSTRGVPAAPRKQAASGRTKPSGGLPRVDVEELEPEMVAAVCAPLPGSPTPREIRELPLPPSPAEKNLTNTENADIEVMTLDEAVEADVHMEPTAQEPADAEIIPVEPEGLASPTTSTEQAALTSRPDPIVIEVSDDDSEVDMENEKMNDVTNRANTPPATNTQTPQRNAVVSLIDQTPAPSGTMPTIPSTGFAFHPHLAHLMALPPQPIQEAEDFLVDLSSPPPKERLVEKDGPNRTILADRGNTHTYLNQFTQDLMTLSGL